MRGFKQQEPSFKQPSRKLSWQFSSASLHPKAGTGENDRYADGASNLRKKPVQKIGEHYILRKTKCALFWPKNNGVHLL